MPLESNTNSEKLEVNSLSAHVTWLLFTNKHSMLMIYIYLQIFCSFQPTFRFQMPFLTFKAWIISSQQIEQSWFLETYKLFAPTQKQLAHPLFSSNSVFNSFLWQQMAFQHKKLLINLKWLFGLFAPAPTKSLIDIFLIEMHNFDGYWMHLVKNLLKFWSRKVWITQSKSHFTIWWKFCDGTTILLDK